MSDAQTPETTTEPETPELKDLNKVIFLGSANPGEENGIIKLANGPNGEPRTLTKGGSPDDALVTIDELHMLTGKFQIQVDEEQPELTQDEVDAQTPEPSSESTGVPVTLPPDSEGDQSAGGEPTSPPTPTPDVTEPAGDQPVQPPAPTPDVPPVVSGDPVSPSTPASPPEPPAPTPSQ